MKIFQIIFCVVVWHNKPLYLHGRAPVVIARHGPYLAIAWHKALQATAWQEHLKQWRGMVQARLQALCMKHILR